jgi:hypothetical protein
VRRDRRCRLGSTARQTCTHAALPQSRMQHLRFKRAHPGMLSVLSLHRAAVLAVLAAGQRAPSEPWWGPWQPRPSGCPLEPVPRRSKRGPAWYKRRASALVSLPPEARALGRLNRGGCVGYNETGARLQRERGPGYNGRLFRRIRLGSCLSRWPQSARS